MGCQNKLNIFDSNFLSKAKRPGLKAGAFARVELLSSFILQGLKAVQSHGGP
jgi:hypothetical protein